MSDALDRTWRRVVRALSAEAGQAVTEYAVVLALVAVIAAAATATGLAQTILDKVTSALGGI